MCDAQKAWRNDGNNGDNSDKVFIPGTFEESDDEIESFIEELKNIEGFGDFCQGCSKQNGNKNGDDKGCSSQDDTRNQLWRMERVMNEEVNVNENKVNVNMETLGVNEGVVGRDSMETESLNHLRFSYLMTILSTLKGVLPMIKTKIKLS